MGTLKRRCKFGLGTPNACGCPNFYAEGISYSGESKTQQTSAKRTR